MNIKTVLPLALALVLGLVAAIVAKNAISKSKNPQENVQQAKIVVALRNVPPGKALSAEDVGLSTIASTTIPENTFTGTESLLNRVTSLPMVRGQPVMEAVLAPQGTGSGAQALIPPGMRAITIEVTEFTGIAGMVLPGSKVDLVSTMHNTKGEGSLARTIVQNVTVLAVGTRVDQSPPPADQPPSRAITLLVNPKDAEMVELAASLGRPRLVLRTNKDGRNVPSQGVTLAKLVGGAGDDDDTAAAGSDVFQASQSNRNPAQSPSTQPAVVDAFRASEPSFRQVTIIRGGVESTVNFRVPARVIPVSVEAPTEPAVQSGSTGNDQTNAND